MKTRLVIAITLSLAGCSLINDFSIGGAGVDAGNRDAASGASGDAMVDSGVDADAADSGAPAACGSAADREALRASFTVEMVPNLNFEEAVMACHGSDECMPPASLPVDELLACVDACLVRSSPAPISTACRGCFLNVIACTREDSCINPCSFDGEICRSDCRCEDCVCDSGCAASLATCTGVEIGFCR